MCNLSQYVLEMGIEQGYEQGCKTALNKIIINMDKEGLDLDLISKLTNVGTDDIKNILRTQTECSHLAKGDKYA